MTAEQLAKMTPEEKRIAIAEACGWTFHGLRKDLTKEEHVGFCAWLPPNWKEKLYRSLPDYLNSLDAMHEAEKVLEGTYNAFIYQVLLAGGSPPEVRWNLTHATAAQRADAFLRTVMP